MMVAVKKPCLKREFYDTHVVDHSTSFKFIKVKANKSNATILLQSTMFDPKWSMSRLCCQTYSLTIDEATHLADKISKEVAKLNEKLE